MCFEMHGLEHEVCAAVNMVLDLEMIKASIVSQFQCLMLMKLSDIPSWDPFPDWAGKRTSGVHQREKKWEDKQNYANYQRQD